MKKWLSLFFSLALLIGSCMLLSQPTQAAAEGDYTYEVADGKAIITGCDTTISGDITIPSVLGEYIVTDIGDHAFRDCGEITGVVIPDGVETIGDNAFENCSSLTYVTIPGSVTSISDVAFVGCVSLAEIEVAEENQSYSSEAGVLFNKDKSELLLALCGISGSYTVPDSVTCIKGFAFRDCSGLTGVCIPSSVTTIGEGAFSGCSGLTSMTIPFVGGSRKTAADTEQYPLGYIFGTESYADGVATEQQYYGEDTGAVTSTTYYIPSSLKSVTVTDGNILCGAFQNCSNLTSVTIGDNVGGIGEKAFSGCTVLTGVNIGNGVTVIGTNAFANCSRLRGITLPKSITAIGEQAFYNCRGLTGITVPNSVVTIGEGAFSGCSGLTSMTIPFVGGTRRTTQETHQRYFGYIFGTASYSGGVATSIQSMIYYIPSSLKSVTVNGGSIIKWAFLNCSMLRSVVLADGVTGIAEGAFSNCSGLTSIKIADGVIQIQEGAFEGCSSLESMTIPFVGEYIRTEDDLCQYPFGVIFGRTPYTGGVKTHQSFYFDKTFMDSSADYYIPGSLKSVTVTGGNILYGAFDNCSNLTSITLPDGITKIGRNAFYGCRSLANITIPDSVTEIAKRAFSFCSGLTNITIPDSVGSIGDGAFGGCTGLKSITIPDSVGFLGESVLIGCDSLESITIPFVGEKRTGAGALNQYPFGYLFGGNESEDRIATEQRYYKDGTLTTTTYYIPKSLRSVTVTDGNILYGAFQNCSNLTSITIGNKVGGFGMYAFQNCTNLVSINIPDSVTNIDSYAFAGCSSLTSIVIPHSVTGIGSRAFRDCTALTRITIPDSVKWSVTGGAFDNCSIKELFIAEGSKRVTSQMIVSHATLKNVVIPDSVTQMDSSIFRGCGSMESLTIPYIDKLGFYFGLLDYEGAVQTPHQYYLSSMPYYTPGSLRTVTVTGGEIGEYAFFMVSQLENVIIGDNVTAIHEHAFDGCRISNLSIRKGITSIGDYAFYNCYNLTSIVLPDSVTSIGESAFNGCRSLANITIPDGVPRIGEKAFYGCTNLSSIIIPDSVTSIGESAFYECTSLTGIKIPEGVPSIGVNTFYNCSSLVSITVPSSVTSVGDYAFYGCESLTYNIHDDIKYLGNSKNPCLVLVKAVSTDIRSCIIPNSTRVIYQDAFSGCEKLYSVTIPNSVEWIGGSAFSRCSSLGSIAIPSSVRSIGSGAFYYSGLTSVTIPDSVTSSIGPNTFRDCNYLTSVTIGDGVTSIDKQAFFGCERLESVIMGNGITTIGNSAFDRCDNLKSVVIGNGVTTIGGSAFSECSSLVSIAIPDSVISIGGSSFYYCKNLSSVTIGSGVTTIGNSAFKYCDRLSQVHIKDIEMWCKISFDGSGATPLWPGAKLYIDGKLAEAVTIPAGITSINDYAFCCCSSLTSVTIPDSVTSIGYHAFYNCSSLTSVTIPDSVTSIGDCAFSRCTNLMDIWVDTDNCAYSNDATGVLFNKEKTKLIQAPSAITGEYKIPDSVTSIESNAFYRCSSLTGIYIPDGVTSIGDYAFAYCSGLKDVYYAGTQTQWDAITISYDNGPLTSATLHTECSAVSQVTVKTLPGKTVYKVDEELDCTGLLLEIVWWDGKVTVASKGFTVSGFSSAAAGVKTVVVTYGGKSATFDVTVEEPNAVAILTQPQSVIALDGRTATFCVTTRGQVKSYQWQYSNDGGITWKDTTMTGYNTAAVEVEVATTRHGRLFRCLITPVEGEVVVSETATLWVPFISKKPTSQTAMAGSDVQFSVDFSLEGATYQWQYKNAQADCTWKNTTMTGYNTDTLTVAATDSRYGYRYRCVITYNGETFRTAEAEGNGAVLTVVSDVSIKKLPNKTVYLLGDALDTTGLTLQITYGNGSVKTFTSGLTVSGFDSSTAGTKTVSVSYGGLTATFQVEVKRIVITSQPQGVEAKDGQTAVFSVAVQGKVSKYQWQYSDDGVNWKDTTMTGYNTESVKVAVTTARHGRLFRCQITPAGGDAVCSEAAKLTVPFITTQPVKQTVKFSEETQFSVAFSIPTGATYQWYFLASDSEEWKITNVTGSTTNTITVAATGMQLNGRQYRCRILYKGVEYISNAATLTLTADKAVVTTQPTDASVISGDRAIFSFEDNSNGAATYQWQYCKPNSTNWSNTGLSGYNKNTLTVPTYDFRDGYQYRCRIETIGGVNYTNAVTLHVEPVADIRKQPVTTKVEINEYAVFSVDAVGEGLVYQWQYFKPNGTDWIETKLDGYNTPTLTVQATEARNGYKYRCRIRNVYWEKKYDSGTGQVYTEAATLKVDIPVVVKSQPADVTTTAGTTVQFSVKAVSAKAFTYQWQYSKDGGKTWLNTSLPGATTATLTVTTSANTNGRMYRCKFINAYGEPSYTEAATLTVK